MCVCTEEVKEYLVDFFFLKPYKRDSAWLARQKSMQLVVSGL